MLIDRGGKVHKTEAPGEVRAIHPVAACEDGDGLVWLLMKNGSVCCYQNGRLDFKSVCKSIAAEKNGKMWFGTDRGLYEIVKGSPAARAFVVGQTIPVTQRLDFLLASKNGGLWVIADGHVQKWKDGRRMSDWEVSPWRDFPVTSACEDDEGSLIVGTYGDGVYWFDSKGTATHLLHELSLNYVHSVIVDREGSLWVGTDGGGLDRVKRKAFSVLPQSKDSVVQSVAPDNQGGLWIAYNGNRIDHWTRGATERFAPVEESASPNAYARAVFVDKGGHVFAGISGSIGPYRLFELQSNKFSGINLPLSDVSAIHQDRSGRLWVGTQRGLALLDPQNPKLYSVAEGLPAADVRAIMDDSEGNIWVGTGGGLACLRDGQITSFRQKDGLPSEDISCLMADTDGILWIGTGGGLVRYYKGHWNRYTTRDGLAGNSIGYIVEDGDNLWLGSNAGLTRVSKKSLNALADGSADSLKCRVYIEADGLPTRECTEGSQPAGCRTQNGVLWFPTTKGLLFANSSALKTNSFEPPVVIESVSVEGQPQSDNPFGGSPPELIVPPGKGELEINYACLDLAAGDRSRFKYRLNEPPQQSDWRDSEIGSRSAIYHKLPPGEYEFQVKACNEDGVWNQTPVSLAIVVRPHLWQRAWFRSVVVLGVLAAIAGLVYYFSTQKLQRQLAFMRQQEALEQERARIARDLHDQLGANLTQVALLAEMAESDKDHPEEVEDHARQITQTARETTKALDEIVWAVNPSNDTLEGLVNYSGKYAQEYFALAGLRYRVDMPKQLPDVVLPPEVRHNVFLAFKESVNNVVKHAKATEVHTRLQLNERNFTFEIEDNGRGLAGAEQKSGRNGLRNMRRRMEDVGGEFSIGPATGQGTLVRLTAPINNR
jgi:signal transduction histidine kinase/ligand-binding sensor domain-containing protein